MPAADREGLGTTARAGKTEREVYDPSPLRHLAVPCTLSIAAIVSAFYIAQRLSGMWSGDLTHVQRVLVFSLHDLAAGQWWRIFTPNLVNGPIYFDFLRPGLAHLVFNIAALLLVGPTIERRVGAFRYVMMFIVSGAVAYGWLVVPLPPADNFDGTSGAVYGLYGALAALVIVDRPHIRRVRVILAAIGVVALLGIVAPGITTTTMEIHLGGFAAGLALTFLFLRLRRPVAVVGTAILVIAALCGLVAARTPEIRQMDARLHPRVASGHR